MSHKYILYFIIGTVIILIAFSSCDKEDKNENPKSTFIDNRDGQTYTYVKIGSQYWMSANLNFISDSGSWVYDNNDNNAKIFGRLYNWETACKVCPDGWHLPSKSEWDELINNLGGEDVAGGKMKEANTTHWDSPNTGATNESGFTGIPGGYRDFYGIDSTFIYIGREGYWWTATEVSGGTTAKIFFLHYMTAKAHSYFVSYKPDGCSVRCARD